MLITSFWKDHCHRTLHVLVSVLTKLLQLCLTLCSPMDLGLPSSSVHGILQAKILEWVAVPPSPGDLPDPGVKPTSPAFPALAGGFFISGVSWEVPMSSHQHSKQGRWTSAKTSLFFIFLSSPSCVSLDSPRVSLDRLYFGLICSPSDIREAGKRMCSKW